MRIVAVADTHTYHTDLGILPDGDLLIHAGDLLQRGSLDELHYVAAWLKSQPHRHKVVIAGNHDWCFVRQPDEARRILGDGIIYLQDAEVVIDGVRIWGSPWQPEFFGWAFNLPRGDALAEKWRLIPDGIDILITHGPPFGIGDSAGLNGHQGCEELLAAVQRLRPLLHLFGHIHEDGGLWQIGPTCFANVETRESKRGATVADVDVQERRVTQVSAPQSV